MTIVYLRRATVQLLVKNRTKTPIKIKWGKCTRICTSNLPIMHNYLFYKNCTTSLKALTSNSRFEWMPLGLEVRLGVRQ